MFRVAQAMAPERPKVVRVHTLESREVIAALPVLEAAHFVTVIVAIVLEVEERG
tara:strand:+ start:399 stop:560 length:162 start_codon:yes stop_codon:yes gene_type:complete